MCSKGSFFYFHTNLQARDAWFQSLLSAIQPSPPLLHLSELIKVARINLFDIATQYQAVFTSPSISTGNAISPYTLFNLPEVSNCRILPSWLTYKMEIIINYIKKDLTDALTLDPTAPVESIKNPIIHFGVSMSRIGMELRPRLLNILNHILKEKMIKNPDSIDLTLAGKTIDLTTSMTSNSDQVSIDGGKSPSRDLSSATGESKMVQSLKVEEVEPKLKVEATTDQVARESPVIALRNETEEDVDDANDNSNSIIVEGNEGPLASHVTAHLDEKIATNPMTTELNTSLSSKITRQGEESPTNSISQQVAEVIEEKKDSKDDLQPHLL